MYMKRYGLLILVLLSLIIAACNLQDQILSPHASISGRNDYVLVAPPGSSPTPTPFQPIPPTAVYLPTSIAPVATPTPLSPTPLPLTPEPEIKLISDQGRSWEDYPGPSVWPDIDIPAPMGVLSHPDGQVNILLLGSDQRPNDGGFRTDTIQLLTINKQENTVKLTAFPRDLYVYIPGYTVQRINTAMGWGGFEALAETMEYNFGVKPDYYVLINFWSFVDVIDSIEGIRVNIGRDLCDQRDAFGWYCVSQGEMWMSGESALWYVRSRYSTSDLDRGRRQQEVLDAVFDKMMSLDSLQRAPELYDIYKKSVTTNLDFDTISSLFPVAYTMGETHGIQGMSIGAGQVYSWTTTTGAMVLVPVREAVLEVMRQVISEP
jgi:LCP family protein required for cell wall assembly